MLRPGRRPLVRDALGRRRVRRFAPRADRLVGDAVAPRPRDGRQEHPRARRGAAEEASRDARSVAPPARGRGDDAGARLADRRTPPRRDRPARRGRADERVLRAGLGALARAASSGSARSTATPCDAGSTASPQGAINFEDDAAKWAVSDAIGAEIDRELGPCPGAAWESPDSSTIATMLQHAEGTFAERVAGDPADAEGDPSRRDAGARSRCRARRWRDCSSPGQAAALAAEPAGLVRDAVEEGLRWVSPIGTQTRRPVVDVELGGVDDPGRREPRCSRLPRPTATRRCGARPPTTTTCVAPKRDHAAFGFGRTSAPATTSRACRCGSRCSGSSNGFRTCVPTPTGRPCSTAGSSGHRSTCTSAGTLMGVDLGPADLADGGLREVAGGGLCARGRPRAAAATSRSRPGARTRSARSPTAGSRARRSAAPATARCSRSSTASRSRVRRPSRSGSSPPASRQRTASRQTSLSSPREPSPRRPSRAGARARGRDRRRRAGAASTTLGATSRRSTTGSGRCSPRRCPRRRPASRGARGRARALDESIAQPDRGTSRSSPRPGSRSACSVTCSHRASTRIWPCGLPPPPRSRIRPFAGWREFVGFPAPPGPSRAAGRFEHDGPRRGSRAGDSRIAPPRARRAAALYCSEEAHYSIERAAEILGLRLRSARAPDRRKRRLAPEAVRRRSRRPRRRPRSGRRRRHRRHDADRRGRSDRRPRRRLRGADVWLHVDGAYGLPAATTPSAGHLFAGLDRVDSVTLDAHKWLYLPKACGVLLVRRRGDLVQAFSHEEAYIPHERTGHMVDITLEYSRPFRALKLWLAFRAHGAQAFRDAVEENLRQARLLYDLVLADGASSPSAGRRRSRSCRSVTSARGKIRTRQRAARARASGRRPRLGGAGDDRRQGRAEALPRELPHHRRRRARPGRGRPRARPPLTPRRTPRPAATPA